MFEVKNFHRNIFVDGSVIFDSDQEVSYTDIVAFSTIKKEECSELIKSNKVLQNVHCVTNEIINKDDVIYHVAKNVTSYGYERKSSNPYNCIYTYNQNILDMDKILKSEINQSKPFGNTDISAVSIYRTLYSLSSINRMVFQSILSNYELFAMDILVTSYLRFERVRERFKKHKWFVDLSHEEIVYKLRSSYYNRFDKVVKVLFYDILEVSLPDYTYLNKAYKERHNLAHRYYTTKYGEGVVIEDDTLKNLVFETNKFVYELFEKVLQRVYQN
ncbi:MAG: hypothetical protein GX921_03545 [Bacteroidales bacterium]|nr:hypothetical protein [Bacteroidales bacterium]